MTSNPDQFAAEVCDYEMQRPLERAGFELQALHRHFSRGSLTHESTEMIWVTSRRLRSAIRDRRAPAGI